MSKEKFEEKALSLSGNASGKQFPKNCDPHSFNERASNIDQSTPTTDVLSDPPQAPHQHRVGYGNGFIQTTPNPSPMHFAGQYPSGAGNGPAVNASATRSQTFNFQRGHWGNYRGGSVATHLPMQVHLPQGIPGAQATPAISLMPPTTYSAPLAQTPAVLYVGNCHSSPRNAYPTAEGLLPWGVYGYASKPALSYVYTESPAAAYNPAAPMGKEFQYGQVLFPADFSGRYPLSTGVEQVSVKQQLPPDGANQVQPVQPLLSLPPVANHSGVHQYRLRNSASSYYPARSTSETLSVPQAAGANNEATLSSPNSVGVAGGCLRRPVEHAPFSEQTLGVTGGNLKRRTQTTLASLQSKSQSVIDLNAGSPGKISQPKQKRAPANARRRTSHIQIQLSVVADDGGNEGKTFCDSDGHYNVKDGELFASRYRLESLLGQGTFGKVVRAADTVADDSVAIKIIRNISKYREASKLEIRALRMLKAADPDKKHRCISLLRAFDFRNHVCMVFELLPSSIFDFLRQNKFHPFSLTQIQQFARQLLDSVAFLHGLKLVHTDLKPENIMLKSVEADTEMAVVNTSETLSQVYGDDVSLTGARELGGKRKRRLQSGQVAAGDLNVKRTKSATGKSQPSVAHSDGATANKGSSTGGRAPAGATRYRKELRSAEIELIDFGSAVAEGDFHSAIVSTRHYRAPEILLRQSWSYPCDLWSVGCILAELFTGQTLFQTHDNLEHLALIEKILGPIPKPFIARSTQEVIMQLFTNQAEAFKLAYPGPETSKESQDFVNAARPLLQLLYQYSKYQPIVKARLKSNDQQISTLDAIRILYDLIKKLLSVNPSTRLTASEAMDHDFFSITFKSA